MCGVGIGCLMMSKLRRPSWQHRKIMCFAPIPDVFRAFVVLDFICSFLVASLRGNKPHTYLRITNSTKMPA